MMPFVIGMDVSKAKELLSASGFSVSCLEYVSRRGIEDADTTRVIRQRELGDQCAEITVSHFKTQVS